jgi:hypothetical protein
LRVGLKGRAALGGEAFQVGGLQQEVRQAGSEHGGAYPGQGGYDSCHG